MPELPEVETVVRQLRDGLVGASVRRVEALRPEPVTRRSGAGLSRLEGGRFVRLSRRGKLLVLETDNGVGCVVSLGMTGHLELAPPDAPARPHTLVRFRLRGVDPVDLRYSDARRFGFLIIVPIDDLHRMPPLSQLGPDALDVETRVLRDRLSRSARPIKAVLLDQTAIAGIGNIYADEILHASGIHPLHPADRVAGRRVAALHEAMGRILREAIACGGSTIRDYRAPGGEPGAFQSRHRVYGRTGEPCGQCGGPIERLVLGGRSTHYCRRCQAPFRGRQRGQK